MSDTSNPHAHTAQTLLGHAPSDTEKIRQLEQWKNYQAKHADKVHGCPFMNAQFGMRIANDDNMLKAGPRGPHLTAEDVWFREKMTHFDHERIPERVVHARGAAAHGFFQVYDDSLKQFTSAQVLTDPSLKTPTFVRFSTVLGSRGSADTVRDVRGFATRFYTQQGNWDLVGNNIPVFFVQDAIKFVDLIHAGKPEPHNEIPQGQTAHDNFWDFISLMPESTHMIMWALSDRTIPRSYRTMQGFGVNTFILVNEQRQRFFVKFHWRPILGVHSLTWDECLKINGTDPDFHRRDLYDAIEDGAYPEYEFGVQIVDESQEDSFDFDLLDCTKLIPEELVPVKWVGKMVLNRNVSEYFTETEQVAYCTQHIVPGIDFSNDPMLQGRNHSYQDTQLIRLGGPNYTEIPINRPIIPVLNNNRDGYMRMTITPGKINYWPNRQQFPVPGNAASDNGKPLTHEPGNTLSESEKEQSAFKTDSLVTYPEKINSIKIRARGPKFQEHYSQAQLFFNSMSAVEQLHITNAAIFELGHVDDIGIRQRIITRLNEIDHQLAVNVSHGIGIPPPSKPVRANHGQKSPALSQLHTAFDSISGRKVAILAADGYDQMQMAAVYMAIKGLGATPMVIGTRKGTIWSSSVKESDRRPASQEESMDFSSIDAPFSLFASRSVLFDSTIIVDGAASIATLSQFGETTGWIAETFKHYKAILAIGGAIQLLVAANLPTLSSVKLATANDGATPVLSQGVVTVASWSMTEELPNGGKLEKKSAGSGLKAMAEAAVGAVASAVGAATGKPAAAFVPNNAVGMFIDGMKKHREWNRDVAKVPA